MTNTITLPKIEMRLNIGPEDVTHWFCEECDDDIAICGFDATGLGFEDGYSEPYCPLCEELERAAYICPRCRIPV